MEEAREKSKVRTEQLLPLADAFPELKSVEKERIRVGLIEYVFPSPEALQDELFKVFSEENEHTDRDASIRKLILNVRDRLLAELKEGRRCLIVAQREDENGHTSSCEMLVVRAKGAFALAEEVLRGLVTREEWERHRSQRREPEIPSNIAQPRDLFYPEHLKPEELDHPEKKDGPTVH